MKSNILKIVSFLFLMLFAAPQLFAHALWIETKATGTKGKAQEISVYFGEFSDNDITKADKWFSDLKDFSLILVSPSKKETKLTSKALDNKYQAFFTPDEDGVYTVVMHHKVKDVYGTMVLDYNSSATVVVGNKSAVLSQNFYAPQNISYSKQGSRLHQVYGKFPSFVRFKTL